MNDDPTGEQIAIMARAAVDASDIIEAENLPISTKASMAKALFLSLTEKDAREVASELLNVGQASAAIILVDNPGGALVDFMQDAVYGLFEVWITDHVTPEIIQQAYIDAGEATLEDFEDLG